MACAKFCWVFSSRGIGPGGNAAAQSDPPVVLQKAASANHCACCIKKSLRSTELVLCLQTTKIIPTLSDRPVGSMKTKGEDTRALIIERSAELFNVYGYHGTSLRDVMTATGLQKGGIYNHFANKDEIAIAAFDYAFSRVIRRFRKKLDLAENSTEKLHAIIDVFKDYVLRPEIRGGCPIVNTAIDATDSHPELKERAQAAIQVLEDYIMIKVEDGKESGEFVSSADSRRAAVYFFTSLEGALMLSRVSETTKYLDFTTEALERFIETELKGN